MDYITKPISPPIVKARVKAHLELYEQKRELEWLVVKLVEQAREIAAWNQTLEQRVAEGVAQLDRLGRMKRFFSPAVADLILSGNADDPLKTHRREIVVVFLDLRGFTAFSESADPEEVMGVLAEYYAAMGGLITKYAGTLEHFAGDGIMIFFNDPIRSRTGPHRRSQWYSRCSSASRGLWRNGRGAATSCRWVSARAGLCHDRGHRQRHQSRRPSLR